MTDNPGAAEDQTKLAKVEAKFGKCATTCVNDHIKILPDMAKRIKTGLKAL